MLNIIKNICLKDVVYIKINAKIIKILKIIIMKSK
jgi:hypothetical protein